MTKGGRTETIGQRAPCGYVAKEERQVRRGRLADLAGLSVSRWIPRVVENRLRVSKKRRKEDDGVRRLRTVEEVCLPAESTLGPRDRAWLFVSRTTGCRADATRVLPSPEWWFRCVNLQSTS